MSTIYSLPQKSTSYKMYFENLLHLINKAPAERRNLLRSALIANEGL